MSSLRKHVSATRTAPRHRPLPATRRWHSVRTESVPRRGPNLGIAPRRRSLASVQLLLLPETLGCSSAPPPTPFQPCRKTQPAGGGCGPVCHAWSLEDMIRQVLEVLMLYP